MTGNETFRKVKSEIVKNSRIGNVEVFEIFKESTVSFFDEPTFGNYIIRLKIVKKCRYRNVTQKNRKIEGFCFLEHWQVSYKEFR